MISGIVGPDGRPIIKKPEVRIPRCSFCGRKLEIKNIAIVSPNGATAMCLKCLGSALFYVKENHGLTADYVNKCWKDGADVRDTRDGDRKEPKI